MKYIFIKEYIYNFNMSTNSYSFVKVTQLPDVAVDGNIQNLSYIGNNSYMLLSYNGDSYKVSTQKFIDVINQHVKRLNDKLDSLITNSSAQPREYDTNVPQEKYIYTYYVTNSYDDERIEEYGEGEELNFTHKKFTILSYGLYSEINTYNHEGESANSEYYTYSLSNGLVTGELLNTYMSYSLDTLLGAPGTLTYVSEAIDSIYEFANWFEGVKRDSSYNALMTYVTNSDYEIIADYTNAINELTNKINELIDSYTSADNEILNFCNSANLEIVSSYTTADMILGNRIDSLSTTINNVSNNVNNLSNDINNLSNNIDNLSDTVNDKQETLISGTNIKTINNQSLLGSGNITIEGGSGGTANYNPGNNISINDDTINCYIGVNSTNNTLTISGTQYSLIIDNNGKLGFEQYSPMSLTGSGGGSLEIDSTASSSNLTFKCTANNNIVTATWSGSETASTSGKTTQITVTQDGNNTIIRTCSASDGKTSDQKTITLQFNKYKVWCFQTTNENFSVTVDSSKKPNNLPTRFHEDTASSVPTINKLTGGSGYVYILIPSNWTSKQFYFGSNFPETPLQRQTISIYSANVNYILYRSVNSLGNVRFELK